MVEPQVSWDGRLWYVYSQAPSDLLRARIVHGGNDVTCDGDPAPPDADFERRYAAILLKERGQ